MAADRLALTPNDALENCSRHEPPKDPRGFGLRQPSAAIENVSVPKVAKDRRARRRGRAEAKLLVFFAMMRGEEAVEAATKPARLLLVGPILDRFLPTHSSCCMCTKAPAGSAYHRPSAV
jgi:hypothetical protein